MLDYQKKFIELSLDRGVLKFGEFVLKSGRVSPYFFNAGGFCGGADLSLIGECYATVLNESGLRCDVLFGPAYKGIPLACATAIAMAEKYKKDLPWCFNRKETKDHGEGGLLVGAPLKGDVVLIDDVITAGTAMRESAAIISAHKAHFAAALIAVDRQERGNGQAGAIDEIRQSLGIKVLPIIRFEDLLSYIKDDEKLRPHLPAMENYREKYGA